MSMSIFSGLGDRVKYANLDTGLDEHQERARKYLTFNQVYTVKDVNVYSSISYVELVEFPAVIFNTVLFEDVEVDEQKARVREVEWGK
jgi:hypothetical protein